MEQIIKNMFLGSDADISEAKKRGYAILACCKDGPNGHRAMLGYTSLAAPHGKDYLFARRGDWMALNLIDVPNPEMIPNEAIGEGLKFIHEILSDGKRIFVHCNAGHSRGPSISMMYLRAVGELPQDFPQARKIFKTIYPRFDPGDGMLHKLRSQWGELKDVYQDGNS